MVPPPLPMHPCPSPPPWEGVDTPDTQSQTHSNDSPKSAPGEVSLEDCTTSADETCPVCQRPFGMPHCRTPPPPRAQWRGHPVQPTDHLMPQGPVANAAPALCTATGRRKTRSRTRSGRPECLWADQTTASPRLTSVGLGPAGPEGPPEKD